jgi:succinylglutamate desuccinylase
MKVFDLVESPEVGIVGCLHGNEKLGAQVIRTLSSREKKLPIRTVIANEEAMKRDVRYIDTDLNRSFPGGQGGGIEERLAPKILKALEGCRYIIDIHSTTSGMADCVVTTTDSFRKRKVRELIEAVPIGKVVIMNKSIGKRRSLIDHVRCGVSIEFSQDRAAESVAAIVERSIRNFGEDRRRHSRKEYFKVLRPLKIKDSSKLMMKDFRRVEKGSAFAVAAGKKIRADYDFYPIFINERGYKDTTCIIAKKIGLGKR